VGESYFRFDSVSTYFPTVTFLFKETGTTPYAKRSQLKLKLKKRNEELTDQDVKSLKVKCR
jgi:hypothetical protein